MPEITGFRRDCNSSHGWGIFLTQTNPYSLAGVFSEPGLVLLGPMPDFDNSNEQQPGAALNRRKPENRWVRILRDAEWDQYETVRRWLKFGRHLLGDKDNDEDAPSEPPSDINKAA